MRWHVVLPCQQRAHHVGREPNDRRHREIDVARQDDQHLPDRDDERNRETGREAIDAAGIEVVVGIWDAEEQQHADH